MESTNGSSPPVPLYPPLGTPNTLGAFAKAGRTVSLALSPRSNSLTIFETPKDISSGPKNRSDTVLYFAQWDSIRPEDVALYTESYVTFESLQRLSFVQQQNEGVQVQSSKNISTCWRSIGVYVDNVHAHLDRLGLTTPFDEARYLHYMEVVSTFHLFQTVYTSDSGNVTTALIGEELLLWLNMHYIAPSSEEGPALDTHEKPWLEENFWIFLIRCVLRGIPKSAVYFLKKLSTAHPSRVLRRLVTELIPILTKHPRSKDYTTEHEFLASYRRWKEQLLKHFRRHVDELEDYDGDGQGERRKEGEWRSAIEIICSIMEGDKQILFTLCKDQEWGWREALGVWGVWIDIRFTREALPTTLPLILESLPINPTRPDEIVQTALLSYDIQSIVEGARRWDLWLAVHIVDMLDRLGELEAIGPKDAGEPSLRTSLLVEYAEYLYSDPSLWQITLEYLGACGAEGRSLVAEVIKRVPIDVVAPDIKATENGDKSNVEPSTPIKQLPTNGADTSMTMDVKELDPEIEAWKKWEAKILKIITVCKDYGLEDVLLSVCKSISHSLMRRGLYGKAVQYSVLARDGRGVGQIADLLLHVYITKGANEFRAQVASIPSEFLPSPTGTIELQQRQSGDIFTSRLQFISRYAEFHNMFSRGEKRDSLKYLVVMLSAGIVPKFWWGVVLLDAGGMLDDDEMLITVGEAYELLRHLEEVHIHAEQGSGADYLGALELIMRGGDQDSGEAPDTNNALRQLQVVRLALARYLARCSVGGL